MFAKQKKALASKQRTGRKMNELVFSNNSGNRTESNTIQRTWISLKSFTVRRAPRHRLPRLLAPIAVLSSKVLTFEISLA